MGRPRSAECDDRAARVAAGVSMTEVAAQDNVVVSAVSMACKLRGVSGRVGQPRTRRGDAMAAMVAGGASLTATGKSFGVSPAAVLKACRRRGVQK